MSTQKLKQEQFNQWLLTNELNTYTKGQIAEAVLLQQEIEVFHPCEIKYLFHSNSFECADVWLVSDFDIIVRKVRGKYRFFSMLGNTLKNISRYEIKDITAKYTEPNEIGVLSQKKVSDWVSYLSNIGTDIKLIDAQNSETISKFKKSIESFHVNYLNSEHTRGSILKNNIMYSFTISEGHISTKIELYYKVNSTITDFLKLSDNGFGDNRI
jgi:hypothetical protein